MPTAAPAVVMTAINVAVLLLDDHDIPGFRHFIARDARAFVPVGIGVVVEHDVELGDESLKDSRDTRVVDEGELITLTRRVSVVCPYCQSTRTTVRSEFGSTACKSIHFCNSCHQPFDHFKTF